jgi:predicted nucleic acid-binding protein
LPSQQDDAADALRLEWAYSGASMVSAPLFDAEVTSTLRMKVFQAVLNMVQGEQAYRFYLELGVRCINHTSIIRTAWDMAKQYHLPRTYDMQYLAVAELLDCPLWTNDKRLVNSVQGKNGRVKWIGDYAGT